LTFALQKRLRGNNILKSTFRVGDPKRAIPKTILTWEIWEEYIGPAPPLSCDEEDFFNPGQRLGIL
jgi:hypothetical protein